MNPIVYTKIRTTSLDVQKTKSVSAAPKQSKAFKPKIVSPQPSKTKKASAQEIQRQKVQSNAVKSVPKTTSVPSTSATASMGKNQSKRVLHNPNSVANIQSQLDPLAFDPTIKKWKTLITTDSNNQIATISWLFPNQNGLADLNSYIVSIDELERRVGADLIGLDLASAIKMQKAAKSWKLLKNCLLD